MNNGILGYPKAANAPLIHPGSLLERKVYDHSTNYNCTSGTEADVDATNLAITFTTPPSGIVKVYFEMMTGANSAVEYGWWSVREGSAAVAGPFQVSAQVGPVMVGKSFWITGLVPGSVHTYKWGWKRGGSITFSMYPNTAGNNPPAVMEVWAG